MIDFAADLAAILDGPLAVDAQWFAGGSPPAVPLRAIFLQPDEVQEYGISRVVSDMRRMTVAVADMPSPAIGDVIEVGSEAFAIHSEPRRDPRRLRWVLHVVPTP